MDTREKFRIQLREKGLRCTSARLEIMCILDSAERPLSHTEVVSLLGSGLSHQATVYRTLISLSNSGLASITSRAGGISRYEISRGQPAIERHVHPHFVCNDCGVICCLPETLISINEDQNLSQWRKLVESAEFQFVGTCLECQLS